MYICYVFFFNDTATTEIYTLSLHDALPIFAMTGKRWDDAELHFEDALTMNTRMGARPWLAHTANDYARMLRARDGRRSEEHTSELQSRQYLVCRLLLEKKKTNSIYTSTHSH